MKNFGKKKLVPILSGMIALSSFNAFASTSQSVGVSGTIYSFDQDSFILEDATHHFWRVNRAVLKKNFELTPGQKVALWIDKTALEKYTPKQ